jgi:hypothetical protein
MNAWKLLRCAVGTRKLRADVCKITAIKKMNNKEQRLTKSSGSGLLELGDRLGPGQKRNLSEKNHLLLHMELLTTYFPHGIVASLNITYKTSGSALFKYLIDERE